MQCLPRTASTVDASRGHNGRHDATSAGCPSATDSARCPSFTTRGRAFLSTTLADTVDAYAQQAVEQAGNARFYDS